MASMESGQTRAASLMNAARRSHFVARIEKYEAKVRQAKAMMKEQKEAMAVADEQRPAFDTEEQQPSVAEKMVIPEKMVMPEQTALGAEQKAHRQHDRDLSHKHLERNRSQRKSHSQPERECFHEQALQQHERGFLSHEEAHAQHASEDSPGHKFFSEQKEIISGMLQRSSSSGMRTIMKGYDALGMATGLAAAADDKVFPMEIMPSDVQANIYIDLKPPPTSEVNIAAVAGALNVRIKAADMSTPMQEHAFRCARECLNSLGKLQSKRIAYTLKKEFDEVYGPAWHCIVGTSFGSYVTHSLGGFVYFSLDKVSVLLFKTTVEPIENS